jgi:uncharacterized protein YggT (Ycf19 family)
VDFINSILNLAGLLLWLAWRDLAINPLIENTTTPLARTLRRAGPSELIRWKYFGGLLALLLVRAMFYEWIGPAVNWSPVLDLTAIVLPFRSELFWRMILFSLFSFGQTLALFYLSLLLLSLVNRRVEDAEPLQKFVRRHLGRVERWPWAVKLLLPFLVPMALWFVPHPLLVHWDIIPSASSTKAILWQGLLIGTGLCLVWKYVAGGMLLLHFLNSHIYFGRASLWSYVNLTARHLLAPLRRLPLRVGRMDFTPVVGIALVFLVAEIIERLLPKIYPS